MCVRGVLCVWQGLGFRMTIIQESNAGRFIGFHTPTTNALRSSQICEAISSPFSARKSAMTAPVMSVRDALQHHIIWQVSMPEGNDLDWWTTLPDFLTPVLEHARRENLWPFRYPEFSEFVYRVAPEPALVNTLTGEVQRMQRVVVMGPRVHDM